MPLGMGREAPLWREGKSMSSDYSDYHSPAKVNARRRAIYIREHAHHALAAVAPLSPNLTVAEVARCAVEQTAALYDALPPDPDQGGEGAPAEVAPPPPRPRKPVADRLNSLADCKQTCDPGVIERYHAHLASSGLQDCGACGARLDVAAHDLLPAEPEATHHAVQH